MNTPNVSSSPTKSKCLTRAHSPHTPHGCESTHRGAGQCVCADEKNISDNPIPVTLHVAPSKPGEAPEATRLKRWLKVGIRSFGVKVTWLDAVDVPTMNANTSQNTGGACESPARRSTARDATAGKGPASAAVNAPAGRAKSTRTHRGEIGDAVDAETSEAPEATGTGKGTYVPHPISGSCHPAG